MLLAFQTNFKQTHKTIAQGTTYNDILNYNNTLMVAQVYFNINLCDSANPENTIITMVGDTVQNNIYQLITDTNGVAVIDTALYGIYDISIDHIGYEIFKIDSITIFTDTTIYVELMQKRYPPRNMYVDSMTNIATWDEPLITALPLETFEDTIFPPVGWSDYTLCPVGWHRADYDSTPGFIVPRNDGFFAVTDNLNIICDHSDDYLILPVMDLRESDNFSLHFDQYFTGANQQAAYVRYSFDAGASWDVLETMSPASAWIDIEVDLAQFSGLDKQKIWLSFHAHDYDIVGSGWAVDNVAITADPAEILGYYVYLDDIFVAQTSADERYFFFDNLVYGENYTACVKALYECGLSEPDCYSWESSFLKPPNNFQDEYVYNTGEVLLKWNPPINYFTPNGLVSFNIYQDSIKIDSIPYEWQGPNDWIYCLVDSLSPDTYKFYVTAVYELSIYGFPGEYDESPRVADTVDVIWGMPFPFFEYWNSGTFDSNNWIVNDEVGNWIISTIEGNPEPCAEFYWQPQIMEPYESSVTSNYIRADSLDEGSIFFDFDIRVQSQNNTGDEKLRVEVFDGNIWHFLTEFENVETVDFTSYQFDISDIVKQKVFQVRFIAHGINTSDIYGWYIDNISIYRTCEAPYNLTGTVDWFTYENPANKICWVDPKIPVPIEKCLYWDNRNNYTGIGLDQDGIFSVAARWFPTQLEQYDEAWITKIEYYVQDGFTSLKLKIWKGNSAGTIVWLKDVSLTTIPNEWNIVELPNPVLLDNSSQLWVGYTVTAPGGTYPAGADSGPAVTNNGDMMNTGSTWYPISLNGYDNNWNIAVYLDVFINSTETTLVKDEIELPRIQGKIIQYPDYREDNSNRASTNIRALGSFNVYRMDAANGSDYVLYDVVEYDSTQEQYCYFDTVPNVNLQNGYYYKVTAVWESDIDYCESEPAMALESPEDDFVYIFLEDITNVTTDTFVKIFPNPTKDYIKVTSTLPMNEISITDYFGQVVYSCRMNDITSFELNTSNYTAGVYLVRINTNAGAITKKIVIAR